MYMCFILGLVGAMFAASRSESVLDLFPEFQKELGKLRTEIRNISTGLNNHITASIVKKAYAVGYIGKRTVCNDCSIPFSKGQSEPSSAFYNGIFTVPYDGVYVMTWTITSKWGKCIYCNLDYITSTQFHSITDSYDSHGRDLSSTTSTLVGFVSKGTGITVRRSFTDSCNDDTIESGLFTLYKIY